MRIRDFLSWLDPYKYLELFIEWLHKKGVNFKILDITLYTLFSLLLAFLILKVLGLALNTEEPMMIVVSPSMVPTLNIGDIVVLKGAKEINAGLTIEIDKNIKNVPIHEFLNLYHEFEFVEENGLRYIKPKLTAVDINGTKVKIQPIGDIVVYYSPTLRRNIIHRAVIKIIAKDGNFYLTKGDSNDLIDEECVVEKQQIPCIYPFALPEDKIISRYWFKIPYLGYIKIIFAKMFGLM